MLCQQYEGKSHPKLYIRFIVRTSGDECRHGVDVLILHWHYSPSERGVSLIG